MTACRFVLECPNTSVKATAEKGNGGRGANSPTRQRLATEGKKGKKGKKGKSGRRTKQEFRLKFRNVRPWMRTRWNERTPLHWVDAIITRDMPRTATPSERDSPDDVIPRCASPDIYGYLRPTLSAFYRDPSASEPIAQRGIVAVVAFTFTARWRLPE